ncbi:hypothetical protein LLG95_16070 [bacterium]|nr:hypothetical protein [bacterium]
MQIFLLWRDRDQIDPRAVELRLRRFYEPILKDRPTAARLAAGGCGALELELPVDGFIPPFIEKTGSSWTLGLDYPVDARRILESRSIKTDAGVLTTLANELEQHPESLLRELAPPFVMAWKSPNEQNVLHIQNDGLGFGQFYIYDDGRRWAASNRILAFKALGIDVRLDADEWATRTVLGWFPLLQTGYRNISFLPPATRLRIENGNVRTAHYDVLSHWLHDRVARDEALELARQSAIDYLRAAGGLCTRASAGMTGGWDTRAVVSTLIAAGIDHFQLHVRGRRDMNDVIIAQRLAQSIGKRLNVNTRGAIPPPRVSALETSMNHALRWQGGQGEMKGAKTFLASNGHIGGGRLNIMGQHGEIGRGFYASRIGAHELAPDQYEDKLVAYVSQWARSWTRPRMRDLALETIHAAYRAADDYGLEGLDRLDFFYLFERTRRWASGGQYNQPGKVFSPFLTPGFIRAAYSMPGPERVTNPLHRYMIEKNMPSWSDVPFRKTLTPKLGAAWRREFRRASLKNRVICKLDDLKDRIESWPWLAGPVRQYCQSGRRDYNNGIYWQTVGRPLVERAMKEGGFWTEVFDPQPTVAGWEEGPDDTVVMAILERICAE